MQMRSRFLMHKQKLFRQAHTLEGIKKCSSRKNGLIRNAMKLKFALWVWVEKLSKAFAWVIKDLFKEREEYGKLTIFHKTKKAHACAKIGETTQETCWELIVYAL